MEEIDEEEYQLRLQEWVERKSNDYRSLREFTRNGKVASFLQRKGFEMDMVWDQIKAKGEAKN